MTARKTSVSSLAAALSVALVFSLAMSALLNFYKFSNTLAGLVRDNVSVVAQDIRESFRSSMGMGMDVSALKGMQALLERQAAVDASIVDIQMRDMDGKLLHIAGQRPEPAQVPDGWLKAALASKSGAWRAGGERGCDVVGWTLRNSFGLPVALLAIEYSTAQVDAGQQALLTPLVKTSLASFAASFALGLALMLLLGRLTKDLDRLPFRASVAIVLVTLAGLVAASWQAVPLFERYLLPKLEQNARQSGQAEAALIMRAVGYGIELEQLYGVEDVMRRDLAENAGLAVISVTGRDGRVLFSERRQDATVDDDALYAVPIGDLGTVTVGLDANFSRKLVREMVLDIVVVLVVAFCLTLEVLSFVSVSSGGTGDPLRTCRVIRAPAFLFFLSEELTRSFLPSFASTLASNVGASLQHVVIGLPIAAFMLVVALTQPWLGSVSQRIGNRRLLLLGAIPAIAGFVICALATDIYLFVAARMLCALGYAAIFVSAQGHVLQNTDESSRSAGFALLVGTIMVATICGPSVGGILADNIGARATFGVAAFVAALAIPLMMRLPRGATQKTRDRSGAVRLYDLIRLVRNRPFLALCVNAAVPAKILLTGYCFFLMPLYVVSIGGSLAMAGRLLMVYALFMVLLVPIASRCADRFKAWTAFILAGLLVSALGGLLAIGVGNFALAVGVVSALGMGQAMSITAQSALVSEVAAQEIALLGEGYVYGIYRLVERMGNAAGPLLAGSLLALFGFKVAFVCLGGLALLSALMFHLLVSRRSEVLGPRVDAV